MTHGESDLAEALALRLPHLDPEAQIRVEFESSFQGGIVVNIDGKTTVVPWSVVAEALIEHVKE